MSRINMNFLSALALILLTLVGYSSGRVLARYKYKVAPGLLDILLAAILWIGALWTRGGVGKGWAILIWLLIGGVVGMLVSILLRDGQAVQRPAPVSTRLLGRVWEAWKAFTQVMGDFQGRMLLIWFYFIIVTPFGLLVRLASDPLKLRVGRNSSFWQELPTPQTNIDEARKQF
jgi:hypothetical protein